MIRPLLLATALLLAGCAGAHETSASAAPSPAQPPAVVAPVTATEAAPRAIPELFRVQPIFMSSIPAHASPVALAAANAALKSNDLKLEQSLRFDLKIALADGDRFDLTSERLPAIRARASHMKLPFRGPTGVLARRSQRSWTEPSFVIDFDSPQFEPFGRSIDRALAKNSDARAIERFVAGYITDKTYTRGFDIASEVAASKTGDCTEHAVLLAAALRRNGIPSRVVFGLLFVIGEQLVVFGHAWVEATPQPQHLEQLDAAAASFDAQGKFQLLHWPLSRLEDEGVGFSRQLARERGVAEVEEVTLELEGERAAR